MANNLKNNTNSQLLTFTITLILHDLHLICSFIISYPLYFSYVIYFSPYVIKLISFISPLFIATVFLSILITTTTTTFCPNLKLGILKIVVQELKLGLDCGIGDECDFDFEVFEIYKIMICDQSGELGFEKFLECSVYGDQKSDVADSDLDLEKLGVEKSPEISAHGCRKSDVASSDSDVDKTGSVHGCRKYDVATSDLDEKKLGDEKLLEASVFDCRKSDVATSDSDEVKFGSVDGCWKEDVARSKSDMNKLGIEKLIEELDKFEDFTQEEELVSVKKVGNRSETINSINHEKLSDNLVISSSRSNSPSIVSSYGSMREDNEWRKTLACKLFEERHNSLGGEEGMDSLWEMHENNNSKNQKKKNTRSISFNTFDTDIDTDSDTDEMVMSNGHLCCLQALKLSTGKMNLGMGKPNIVKITKAFKGFGWLNYVKKQHSKKS